MTESLQRTAAEGAAAGVAAAGGASRNDPLWIGDLPVPGLPGQIGLTILPGRKAGARRGAATFDRDLEADMRDIAEWGPSLILTLLEPHEARELGVPDIATAIPPGIEHRWLPIVNRSVPDQAWLARWRPVAKDVVARLRRGERVLLHCRAGRGRAGLVAGLLLRDCGLGGEEAVRWVREASHGALEHRRQQRFVIDYQPQFTAPIAGAPRPVEATTWEERFVGSLLAGAAGDALGAPVEFNSHEAILVRFGRAGIIDFAPAYGRRGAITDDTQMALFTAEAMRAMPAPRDGAGESPGMPTVEDALPRLGIAYQYWLRGQGARSAITARLDGPEAAALGYPASRLAGLPAMRARRAPGLTCLSALEQMRAFDERAINQSKGSGAVMRVAPVGLFVAGRVGEERLRRDPSALASAIDSAWTIGAASAAITHGHSAAQQCAGYLAALVMLLAAGRRAAEAELMLQQRVGQDPANMELRRVLAEVDAACEVARRRLADGEGRTEVHAAVLDDLGEGWTADEATAMALYCLRMAQTLEEGLVTAVNIDGDSDTVGTIAGQLLGAVHGVAALPPRWRQELELADVIEETALALAHAGA